MTDVYVSRGLRLAARKVDGEMVILAADDSSLYVLNEIGTTIWEAADGRTTLGSIVERIVCAQYAIDVETALKDAHEFVHQLARNKVLCLSDAPLEDRP